MEGSITNMVWQPELIKLTQIPRDDVDGGGAVTIFLHPAFIVSIHRHIVQHRDMKGEPIFEPQCATVVALSTNQYAYVTESPSEVAALRDVAFGHRPKNKLSVVREEEEK